MKRQATDAVALEKRLRSFMVDAGWTQTRISRGLSFFSPPVSLGIRGNYTIALPDDPAQSSVSGLIHDAADALVQVYGYGQLGDLLNRAASLSDLDQSSLIISRFRDDSTKGGTMPLTAISAYLNSMETTLYRSAKFHLGVDTRAIELAARQFVKDSFFLQTAVGSFVAKIEIPATVLRQADLFGTPALDSTEVTSALFAAFNFLNDQILSTDVNFDDTETLANAITLFDVELLTAITEVLLKPAVDSIDFSFEFGNRVRTTSTGWLSEGKRTRLKNFVVFVTEQLRSEDSIDIVGSIVELRSRDPAGDHNHIRVVANFHHDRTFITATLSNVQYQLAVDAHRNKRDVRLVGKGMRLKTQVRITELQTLA